MRSLGKRAIASLLAAVMLLSAMPAAMAAPVEPKFAALTSSENYGSDYDAAKAFDGDLSTRFASKGKDVATSWIAGTFSEPTTIQKLTINEYTDPGQAIYQRLQAVSVQTSQNGSDWTEVKKVEGLGQDGATLHEIVLDQPLETSHLKLEFTAAGEVNITEITLDDGDGSGEDETLEKIDLSKAEFAWSSEYNGLYPDGITYIFPATYAIDGNLDEPQWAANDKAAWLSWDFPEMVILDTVKVYETASNNRLAGLAVDISEDGETWTEYESVSGLKSNGSDVETWKLHAPVESQHIRVRFITDNQEVNINEVELYAPEAGTVLPPQAEPGAGTYDEAQQVTLTAAAGAEIYYTTDGTAPTTESTRYTAPITVDQDMDIRAIAVLDGKSSTAVTFSYHMRTVRERLGLLIDEAKTIDLRLYKIQSKADFQSSLNSAETNYANTGMADSQLQDTINLLQAAMEELLKNPLENNLALNKKATAESVYEDMESYNGQKTVDGDFSTRWASKANADGPKSFYLTIDLGQPTQFNQVLLYEHQEYAGRIRSLSVRVSDDGETWTDWRLSATPVNPVSSLVAEPVTARYVQIELDAYAGQGMNVDEVGIYYDLEAIETEPITKPRPIDPDWHKPEPSDQPTVFQERKTAMEYGLFLHYGVNTFNQVEWGNGNEELSDYHPNTETLDPESWVRTAWEAGMGYVVLITKHHDGFVMFDTEYTDHCVMNVPDEAARRDIVKEVAEACQKYGIKLGLYYSIWDMHWEKEHPKTDYPDQRAWDQAYTDYAYNQIEELMTNYGPIAELWIDGGWLKSTERWEYERIYNMVKTYQPGCQMSVNLTLGYTAPSTLQGGETILNFPSDFCLYDGQDTANSDTHPKLFTYAGETYFLPFEGTFRIGNGWFWNKNSSPATIERDAENIQSLYTRYMKQGNTLVINVPPTDQGVLTDFETEEIYKAARLLGIAKGSARADVEENPCEVLVRYVTEDGAIAATTQAIYGKAGETYTATEPENMKQLGYELVKTPANVTGTFTDETIVVEYVYRDVALEEAEQEDTPSVTRYAITVQQTEGGKISPATCRVDRGSDKTFTIKANEGYEISDVLVDGKSVGKVTTYTFENVKSTHTITAKFTKDIDDGDTPLAGVPYTDVMTGDWFAEAVKYVTDHKLMGGVSETAFAPNAAMTRAMFVTVLARMEGVDTSTGSTWYEAGQKWAMENGISDGTNMEGTLTREQLATMLYRYAGTPAVSDEITGLADADKVSDWASDAMKWAVAEGIVGGSNGKLNPQGSATRAQVAAMLMRYLETKA